MSTEKKTTNYVSFIWKIANLLRGDYKEHEYGDVILRSRCSPDSTRCSSTQ